MNIMKVNRTLDGLRDELKKVTEDLLSRNKTIDNLLEFKTFIDLVIDKNCLNSNNRVKYDQLCCEIKDTFAPNKQKKIRINKDVGRKVFINLDDETEFSFDSEDNADAINSEDKQKPMESDFEYCTKRFLSDLNRHSETDQHPSHSHEPESNQSNPQTITNSNNTIECNEMNFAKQSKTQIVLSEESVDHKECKQYRCVWPGCQFGTDQTDQSETHRLVRLG